MLAKVGWRIKCNPDSLLVKVLQAKYYPSSSFLEAPVGKGTLQGRKVFKVGIRWRVRDENIIHIVKDSWLPTLRTCQPISRHEEMSRMVADMVVPRGVYGGSKDDGELGWKGVGQSSKDDNRDPGCRNILVVHTNLQLRGIRLETSCPFCAGDVETQVHLFFRCLFARVFWFGSPFQLDVTTVVGGDFMECWKWLCKKYGEEGEASDLMRWVVCGLWRIWKCQNSVVFEKIEVKPSVAL
ncbi:uncharacterized protein [Malus domestica]|uniref:uncharacterized protein n=1 Tax=Malus domestica TaxID=3750 RepID=UPI0039766D6C